MGCVKQFSGLFFLFWLASTAQAQNAATLPPIISLLLDDNEVIAFEPFTYSTAGNTQLNGRNGGRGWADAWAGTSLIYGTAAGHVDNMFHQDFRSLAEPLAIEVGKVYYVSVSMLSNTANSFDFAGASLFNESNERVFLV